MNIQGCSRAWNWQVAFSFLLCSWGWVSGQLRYSVAEEADPGTVVGNVAQDLRLNLMEISKRRLNLGSQGSSIHFSVNQVTGSLTVKDRIDRESLCGSSSNCLLHIEIVAENPLELFSLEIDILDINDNAPIFPASEQIIRITELVSSRGARFPLEIAQDADVGTNGIHQYKLSPSPYFSLSVKNRIDGTLIPQLVLENTLDREDMKEHSLVLTAYDGGDQPRSGSTQITIAVLDINDNAPVFDQSVYKISILENLPLKTVIITLNATDPDEGVNGEIEYAFDHHTSELGKEIFDLHPYTGAISVRRTVDFEEANIYELSIRAVDKGIPELEGYCLIQIHVQDINDNAPEIYFSSMMNEVPENSPPGTVVGFVNVKDRDSGKNGEVRLQVSPGLPFTFKPFKNHFSLITDGILDRETVPQYTIQIIASDLGVPPLNTETTIMLNISDINDNPPVFLQQIYNAFITENNDPGSLLCSVSAIDPDIGFNSNLIYSIADSMIDSSSISSFVYINPSSGHIYAQHSFDYEHIQVLQIIVRVEDSGFPKLSSNVTLFIFVLDTNDNYPTVLYPDLSRELTSQEKIPISASAGYLVTKISAIDLDAGRNAWLTYSLLRATNPNLYHISEFTGEIRTTRSLEETENAEQQLLVLVRDHGEPALSTTVTIFVNVIDTVLQNSHKSPDYPENSKVMSDLTMYLIISLVAIGLVSVVTFIILLVKCFKKEYEYTNISCCFANKSQSKPYGDQYQPTLFLNTDGTLKYMEVRMVPPNPSGPCYPTCFPPTTNNQDFTFVTPPDYPQLDNTVRNTEYTSDNPSGLLTEPNQAQPNTEWRFSQAQRPGPSGAQPTEEAGVWPNNQFETERLQAMILASANEAAEGTSGLGGGTGTMGLSARYGPQFTLQHVPDYRQNVYIPGSTLTPTNPGGKRDGKGGGNKKKSGKKEKK
ncbi:protocadherin gamma-C5-like isoform X3 [Mixophyes fleayi]|uniref:protocadherin gamma-C5-like isoform X3 n=1 Tax=Mixophyes fleayi TaxID=3061075 RepID=UPI003F4DBCBD